jgi:hypothetical protein
MPIFSLKLVMAMVNRSACIYIVDCGRANTEGQSNQRSGRRAQRLGGEALDWRNCFSVQSSPSEWKLVDPFLETEGYLSQPQCQLER